MHRHPNEVDGAALATALRQRFTRMEPTIPLDCGYITFRKQKTITI
jgi:hypothetical protein